uniref:Uncharacterized protein n=1 Tax=Grammatophora oceanica TaxID=210454 RepID=A0A7S1UMG6_9STRA|mmetsp:Transcript_12708/g.18725  ORF Transcript_12708/g.18725 Transcript_12708/m.18725 type:complete len:168 (+) Transcript_12708:361-864(+)
MYTDASNQMMMASRSNAPVAEAQYEDDGSINSTSKEKKLISTRGSTTPVKYAIEGEAYLPDYAGSSRIVGEAGGPVEDPVPKRLLTYMFVGRIPFSFGGPTTYLDSHNSSSHQQRPMDELCPKCGLSFFDSFSNGQLAFRTSTTTESDQLFGSKGGKVSHFITMISM